MAISLMPVPKIRFFSAAGVPLAGGKVYTYEEGTSTNKATYTDSTGATENANPVILDANGEASIWLNGYYKIVLKDSNDVLQWTIDNVSSSPADNTVVFSEWLSNGLTPTYVSATQFSVPGDETSRFHVGRRVKCTVSAGTVYGRITASSYASSITTVTVTLDSGNLDNGLSAVDEGLLSATNSSVPTLPAASSASQATIASQIQAGGLTYALVAGTDTYTASLSPAITAYATGMEVKLYFANGNATTTPTINLNGLGAKTIKRGNGVALSAGDIPANHEATLIYNGTDFIIKNPKLHNHSDGENGGLITNSGMYAILGAWDAGKVKDTVYQAASDLLVIASITGTTSGTQDIIGYTDSSNPPTTVRAKEVQTYASAEQACITFPVKRNDYWKVTTSGTGGTVAINVIPIGSNG